MKKSKVINIFGGPSTGKSTLRAELFYKMKKVDYSVEEATEYAKDLVWEENDFQLKDQLTVLANQNLKLARLNNKVDYIITDSPLFLSLLYKQDNYLTNSFDNLVLELFHSYDNVNYVLKRKNKYETMGRIHDEEQAKMLDHYMMMKLKYYKIPFWYIDDVQDIAIDLKLEGV